MIHGHKIDNQMDRRAFIIGGGMLGAATAIPTGAQAFWPVLGWALANLTIGFGVRLGARRLAQTAVNMGATGLSLSARQAFNVGKTKMAKGGFSDPSRAQITVAANVPFFPMISRDGRNACTAFLPLDERGESKLAEPILLEGPTLWSMAERAPSVIQKFGQSNAKKMLLPQKEVIPDLIGSSSTGISERAFKTVHGYCWIGIHSEKLKGTNTGGYRHSCRLNIYDNNKRFVFGETDHVDMQVRRSG